MNFSIYFCADGVLRAKFAENKPMLSLKFIQENSPFKNNDFRFMTKWWESHTFFEKDLTVATFLQCLEPWSEFWTDLTGKDVTAYVKEVRVPYVVKNKTENSEEEDYNLDWIQLSHNIDADIESEYEKTPESEALLENDMNAWFNSKQKMRLTGKWNIYNSFTLSGFIKGHGNQYSVEYTPINELANVPLVLNHTISLAFAEHPLRRYTGNKQESIIKEDSFGVTTLGDTHYLMGHTHFSLREVVEGFFYWMMRNPKSVEGFIQSLKDDKEEIDSILALEDEELDKLESSDNVIPLFKNDSENTKEEESTDTNKPLEVKVAPNAFSSIIDHWERDSEFWDNMIQKAANQEIVTKIGKTIEQEPLEKRYFGFVLDDNNIKHIPQPNDFKDLE